MADEKGGDSDESKGEDDQKEGPMNLNFFERIDHLIVDMHDFLDNKCKPAPIARVKFKLDQLKKLKESAEIFKFDFCEYNSSFIENVLVSLNKISECIGKFSDDLNKLSGSMKCSHLQ